MDASQVTIRPMFRDLCPALTREERQQLHDNIVENGVMDRVKVWDGVVIDGHNRVEIAGELGIEFDVEELHFDSDADAKEWIIKHQLGRRNLDPDKASYLRGKLYNERKKPEGRPEKLRQSDGVSGETAEQVAEETGVSPRTVERDGQYAEALDALAPKARQAIERKDVKPSREEVKRLSEQPEDSQADIVETVMMGDQPSIKAALDEAEGNEVVELSEAQQAVELASEFAAQVQAIGKIRGWVKSRADGPAGRYLTEHFRKIDADLKNAQAAIKTGTPYAVCCYCNGRIDHELRACEACRGWGWLTRQQWDNAPEELR